ncbi:MAG: pyruvate dehydrogenase complex dihydrolipoamide acetyltransferase [Cytophagales bacterium]|nr:pyruvate dehydrogenase complex dihydrolipoamide acetyltransferase [Cytophagales bacterium]
MAEVIRMPKMSDTMEEGVIATWLKQEGDAVKSGDILAEVETDKATMELEAYEEGTLLYMGVKEKEAVPVNGVIAIIGEKGEDIAALVASVKQEGRQKKDSTEEVDATQAQEESDKPIDISSTPATVITMPKMSDTMTEGVIAAWLKQEGDAVKPGDILAQVATDKTTMELEAYQEGTLLYIGVKEKETVPVDGVLAVIGEQGTDYEKLLEAHQKQQRPSTIEEVPRDDTKQTPELSGQQAATSLRATAANSARIKASPLAKKMAQEKDYPLAHIEGTGRGGRIIKRDVEAFVPSTQPTTPSDTKMPPIQLPAVVGEESYEEVPVSQLRKTIAKRLSESKFTAPHFYLTVEVNMDKTVAARESLNEHSTVKISFNDLIIKAVATALRQHPGVNASWLQDKIRYNKHIHIGVAVAIKEGLLVPVVRFADNKSLSHIATEVKQLSQKARNKQLQPQEWEGSTFTISNLGMLGIETFTAIINPPDACILAVGGIKQVPVVKEAQIVPGYVMKVTLSCDHRVVDGALGAAFLKTLKELLEDPLRILI